MYIILILIVCYILNNSHVYIINLRVNVKLNKHFVFEDPNKT